MQYNIQYIPEWRIIMRKLLIILISAVFMLAASGAFADMVFKGSYDVRGTAKYESFETSAGSGFSLSVEYYKPILKILQIGGGIEYQFPRAYEDNGEFNFIPIYGSVRVVVPIPAVKPYAIGRIGYNFFRGDAAFRDDGSGGQADLKGGLTYGIGGGVILFKYVLIEGMYNVNKGTLSDAAFTYSRFQLSAGVNLGF